MSIPTKNKRNSIPMRITEYMCKCVREPVCLYSIPYKSMQKSALSLFLLSLLLLALNRLIQAKAEVFTQSDSKYIESFVRKQRLRIRNKRDKLILNTFASFRAEINVFRKRYLNALHNCCERFYLKYRQRACQYENVKHGTSQPLRIAAYKGVKRVLDNE